MSERFTATALPIAMLENAIKANGNSCRCNSTDAHTTKGIQTNFKGKSGPPRRNEPRKTNKAIKIRPASEAARRGIAERFLEVSFRDDHKRKHGVTTSAPIMSPSHQVNHTDVGAIPF